MYLHSSGLPAEMPWPLPRSLPAWSMPAYMHLSGSKGLTTSPGKDKQGISLLKAHASFYLLKRLIFQLFLSLKIWIYTYCKLGTVCWSPELRRLVCSPRPAWCRSRRTRRNWPTGTGCRSLTVLTVSHTKFASLNQATRVYFIGVS